MVNITKEKNKTTQIDENMKDETILDTTQNGEWLDEDDFSGQLAVDVYQNKDEIIIKSTIAGVRTEDIDIAINNDMITIRGKREKEDSIEEDDYFYRECYWGGFSRSIILPCDVKSDKVKANMKNGVLTIVLPKADKVNKVTVVKIKEE